MFFDTPPMLYMLYVYDILVYLLCKRSKKFVMDLCMKISPLEPPRYILNVNKTNECISNQHRGNANEVKLQPFSNYKHHFSAPTPKILNPISIKAFFIPSTFSKISRKHHKAKSFPQCGPNSKWRRHAPPRRQASSPRIPGAGTWRPLLGQTPFRANGQLPL